MKIAIGSDHAGYDHRLAITTHLQRLGHEVMDMGTLSPDSTDYPLWIIPTAEAVAQGRAERGIVLGGSGNGEAIAANKVKGIRCALCWSEETAELSRRHNDANVLSMGQRVTPLDTALRIVEVWLAAPFDGGRHARRIAELTAYENSGSVR